MYLHIFFSEKLVTQGGNEIKLVSSNLALQYFPKFFYAKVRFEYKHSIYAATNHSLQLEWISDSKFSPNETRRKVLTE